MKNNIVTIAFFILVAGGIGYFVYDSNFVGDSKQSFTSDTETDAPVSSITKQYFDVFSNDEGVEYYEDKPNYFILLHSTYKTDGSERILRETKDYLKTCFETNTYDRTKYTWTRPKQTTSTTPPTIYQLYCFVAPDSVQMENSVTVDSMLVWYNGIITDWNSKNGYTRVDIKRNRNLYYIQYTTNFN